MLSPLRSFLTTHPQYSAQRRCRCVRHSQQSHDHCILVTHVGVVQCAQPLNRLPQCNSTTTNRAIPLASIHVSPLIQGAPCCNLLCVSHVVLLLGSARLARPRPSHQPQAKTHRSYCGYHLERDSDLTDTAAVDPVTVTSTCTMLAQP